MKILLALDGSPCSKLAIDSLIRRPWPEDCSVLILTVLEPFHPELAGWHSSCMPLALDAQKERQHQAEELLNETAKSILDAHPTMNISVRVIEGLVKETILDTAKEMGADMIVLGSHGRKGITKLFLGSVSEHVLSQANCSVEIVKA